MFLEAEVKRTCSGGFQMDELVVVEYSGIQGPISTAIHLFFISR